MDVGDRVVTTAGWCVQWGNDRLAGSLVEVLEVGLLLPSRTHKVELDQPWGEYRILRFDPKDLEPEHPVDPPG